MRQVPDPSWLILFSLLSISNPTDGTLVPLHWVTTLRLRDTAQEHLLHCVPRSREGWPAEQAEATCRRSKHEKTMQSQRGAPLVPGNIPVPGSRPWWNQVQLCILPPFSEWVTSISPKQIPFHLYWDVQFSVLYNDKTSTQRKESTLGRKIQS